RIDRVSGKRVFGTFPTSEDPKSSVIWEAFQPETEPRRSFRSENSIAANGSASAATPKRPRVAGTKPTKSKPLADDFLQRQGGIY
ncbi:MAG: hypothetical protein LH610_01700, partial [Sphingomonas bacterium]|nr:hypothetical protein [Sphingomonas bacterium]